MKLLSCFWLALVLFVNGVKAQDKPASPKPFTESSICKIPENLAGDVFVSDDSKHWCAVVSAPGGKTLVGDQKYAPTDYKVIASIQWSPVSGRCGFWAQKDNGIVVVVDGKEFTTGSYSEGTLEWSEDGKRWLAAWGNCPRGQRGDCVVLVDGAEVGHHSDIGWPWFSRNGAHYGYFFKDDGALSIAVDGKKTMTAGSNFWAYMATAVCGPNIHAALRVLNDGSVAYIAPMPSENKIKDGDLWTAGKASEKFASYQVGVIRVGNTTMQLGGDTNSESFIAPDSLALSKDGSSVGWWASNGKKGSEWSVFLNGKKIYSGADARPNSDRISLSSDGKRVAFRVWQKKDEKTENVAVWTDGKVGTTYDWLGGIQFSEDSKRTVYWAKPLGSTNFVYVVDGKEVGTPSESQRDFTFSPDSRHWTFISKRGNDEFLVADSVEVPLGYKAVWGLRIGNDGVPRFFARTDKDVLAVAGKAGKAN